MLTCIKYDDQKRIIYYQEGNEYGDERVYKEWREYCGKFAHLKDNKGNERWIEYKLQIDTTKEEFEKAKEREIFNPDLFKFELLEM